jgi:UDP-glucose:(heptosyl)LPS alpha-1,3-glucosyltransferase
VRIQFGFGIVSLFPGGGLQRDCIDIARRVCELGHEVTIFTMRLHGSVFTHELPVHILPARSRTNHQRQAEFSKKFMAASAVCDFIVGFDKLKSLDLLYCSDPSMLARVERNPMLYLFPRYRRFIDLERSCFAQNAKTKVLLLSEAQLKEYTGAWGTQPERLVLLPPTISRARQRPELRTCESRMKYRASLGLGENDWVWIAICVQPLTKGLDRIIRALQSFSDARLLVVGLEETEHKSIPISRLARQLGVSDRIRWLGHREDVPALMAAADLFVHPARNDTTGTVILESIVNGLPVITMANCGYAKHVVAADAGIVLGLPFRGRSFLEALHTAHQWSCASRWSLSARRYGERDELYLGRRHAADLIVATAEEKLTCAGTPRHNHMLPFSSAP